jgi:hypothetical protein
MAGFTVQELRQSDTLTVDVDGEELEVYGWLNIERRTTYRGSNPVVAPGEPEIGAGDSRMKPEAVTHWVAEEVEADSGIDVEDHGIRVIDPTDEEVDVL